jgi:hypothetical protein
VGPKIGQKRNQQVEFFHVPSDGNDADGECICLFVSRGTIYLCICVFQHLNFPLSLRFRCGFIARTDKKKQILNQLSGNGEFIRTPLLKNIEKHESHICSMYCITV